MKKKSKIILIIAIVSTLICTGWATVRIVKSVQFDFDCKAYLKRAADANTVELAKNELGKAIEYVEENKLTEGIVSIFLKNPANDLGFWYQNMKSAYEELENLEEDSSALEKTNVLMKLRESLTDSSDGDSTSVITPEGITVYPNNVIYFIWGLGSFVLMIVFWIAFCISIDLKLDTDTVQVRKKIVVKKSA
jgi:hypothetical protein